MSQPIIRPNHIEFDQECTDCNGTGLYQGMGERDGVAVVCHSCKGTGKIHRVIEWKDFNAKKREKNVKRVIQHNPGICVGKGINIGGMSYEDWFQGKEFPPKSEMREYTCPAWWYQGVNYSKKPNWKECVGFGAFSDCSCFRNKNQCWKKWDTEHPTSI